MLRECTRGTWLALLVVTAATAGCAKKTAPAAPIPPAPATVDITPAEALFGAGCYRCLEQAYSIYERALTGPAPVPEARAGAFVTAVLLAVREKEIGLEATRWLDRAAGMALADDRIYVDIVRSLSWTSAGAATDFEPARPEAAARERWQSFLSRDADVTPAALLSAGHFLLHRYLRVATACGQNPSNRIAVSDADPPILQYRMGLCGPGERRRLEAVLADDARFVEASFFIGRYEMATAVSPGRGGRPNRRWLVTAVPPLSAAHQGLPESPIIATVYAGLLRSRGELDRALAVYDAALVARPSQRDALLGRTIALTYLSRGQEAIDTATRMIELGTWYLGSAYYWRAFNRYHSSQLELAASDVAMAKRLQINDDVMVLSGMIAYDQKRPKDARADFSAAVDLNRDNCAAQWHLGILDLDEEAWRGAVGRFSTSAACYERVAGDLRAEAAELPADLPEDNRLLQLAGYETSISTSLRQAGRSLLNAAQASLRLGDRTSALAFARSAAVHDDVKERAASIVRSLEP